MSGRSSNLRNRLGEVERKVGEVVRREQLAKCNCNFRTSYSAWDPEEFEGDINLPCPAHGFRDLGFIVLCRLVDKHGVSIDSVGDARREQLFATYNARRASHQAALELKEEDESEEF